MPEVPGDGEYLSFRALRTQRHRVEHQGTVDVIDASESRAFGRALRDLAVQMPKLLEDGEVKLRARVLSEKEREPVSPYAFDVVLTVEYPTNAQEQQATAPILRGPVGRTRSRCGSGFAPATCIVGTGRT